MARYDYDSQIDFIQKQFDDAQKRGEKRGKRMVREALKTQAIGGFLNLGIRGINNVLNRKADELHMQQVPQLARYQQYINDYSKTMNMLDPYLSRGGAIQDNVRDYLYDSYVAEAGEKFTEYEPGSYTDFLFKKAQENSLTLTPIIQTLRQEGADVGSLENFTNNYARYANHATPRTIGGAIVKTVKDFFNRNNEETIKYNDEKAKDALYNTPLFNEITELGNAVRAYGAQGNGVSAVIRDLQTLKNEGKLSLKADKTSLEKIKINNNTEVLIYSEVFKDEKGNVSFRQTPVGDPINIPEKQSTITSTELNIIKGNAESAINDFGDKTLLTLYNDISNEEDPRNYSFHNSMALVSKDLQKRFGINRSDADNRAALFLIQQVNLKKGDTSFLRETMSGFDLIYQDIFIKNKSLSTISFEEAKDIMPQLTQTITTSDKTTIEQNYQFLIDKIKQNVTLDRDEKIEIVKDLNNIFGKEVPEIPEDNYVQDIINNEDDEDKQESLISPFFQYERTFRNNPLTLPREDD